MRNLDVLCQEVHEYAKAKGWWQKPRSPEEIHMLCVSEVAEATEAVRDGRPPVYAVSGNGDILISDYKTISELGLKPDGEAVELIDCVIRAFDYFGYKQWSMEKSFQPEHRTLPKSKLGVHLKIANCFTNLGDSDGLSAKAHIGNACGLVYSYFQKNEWDFFTILDLKQAYNQKRPYRHGGKLL